MAMRQELGASSLLSRALKKRAIQAKFLLIYPNLPDLSVAREGNAPLERELRGFERSAGVW